MAAEVAPYGRVTQRLPAVKVSKISTGAIGIYGAAMRTLRSLTNHTVNREPKWRHNRPELMTGYHAPRQIKERAS